MAHRLSYLNIPLDQCSKEQLIECIEGLDRNLKAARDERDRLEKDRDEWANLYMAIQ